MKKTVLFILLLLLTQYSHAFLLDEAFEAAKKQDYKTAFKVAIKFAKEGHAEAQNYVAILYSTGWGVEKDYQAAVNWTRKALKQGSVSAMCNMGDFYRDGNGVEQDYQAALNWYHKGAKSESYYSEYCQTSLGIMYSEGTGVVKDKKLAKKWYEKACDMDPKGFACILHEELEDKGY